MPPLLQGLPAQARRPTLCHPYCRAFLHLVPHPIVAAQNMHVMEEAVPGWGATTIIIIIIIVGMLHIMPKAVPGKHAGAGMKDRQTVCRQSQA